MSVWGADVDFVSTPQSGERNLSVFDKTLKWGGHGMDIL